METELENLVVRMTGEASDYQRMLRQASQATRDAANAAERDAGRMSHFLGNVSDFARGAIQTLAGIGLGSWLREGLGEWQTAEATALRLSAAIRGNGGVVEDVLPRYQEYASQLQNITVIGDDTTLATIALAESYGLSGEAAIRATESATAFAAINGGAADSYLRLTAAIERGDTELAMQMGRLVPQLRGITDESEFLARAQRLVATGMEAARAEAQSSRGQIAQLKNAYGDLLEEVGHIVADALAPVVQWAKDVVSWFQGLDQSTKEFIVTVALLTAAFLTLAGVVTGALALWNVMTGGVGAIIGLVVAAAVAIAAWVSSIGGVRAAWAAVSEAAGAAWTFIKDQVSAFVAWVRPITFAIGSFFRSAWDLIKDAAAAAWDGIKEGAQAAWDFITSIWTSIVGDAEVNWDQVRDTIRDAIFAAEFIMMNFGDVAAMLWTEQQLKVVRFANQITHVFTHTIPELFSWFVNNFGDIMATLESLWRTTWQNMTQNVGVLLMNLPGIIAGTVSVEELWTPLTQGFQNTIRELPQLSEREISGLEADLADQLAGQQNQLQQGFEEFRRARLGEMMGVGQADEVAREAERAGERIGDDMNRGAAKEIQKFDAAISGSAEALGRLAEFQDRLTEQRAARGADHNPGAAAVAVAREAVATAQAVPAAPAGGAAAGRQDTANAAIVDLLRAILEVLRANAGQGPDIALAEIEGA